MNKEEMEKKRNELATEKIDLYLPNFKDILKSIGAAVFCVGWDHCAAEYEKELQFAKADIMNLLESTEQLNKNQNELMEIANYWRKQFDALKSKYEPQVGMLSKDIGES